jgi:uncharacterized protein (DUF433 family)
MNAIPFQFIVGGQREGPTTAAQNRLTHAALPTFRGGFMYTFTASTPQPARTDATVAENIRGGVPTVGTGHWPIATILEQLAQGRPVAELPRVFPGLTPADVTSALAVAAWVMREPKIDWKALVLEEAVGIKNEWEAWERASNQALNWVESYRE